MPRLALLLAFAGVFAVGLPSPGLYVAIGCGLAAIGVGWAGWARRDSSGAARLAAAAAITVGLIGLLLGVLRVALVLAAIDHVDKMIN